MFAAHSLRKHKGIKGLRDMGGLRSSMLSGGAYWDTLQNHEKSMVKKWASRAGGVLFHLSTFFTLKRVSALIDQR